MQAKWIFIKNKRPLHWFLGHLQQNAVQYAVKRSAFWCKTQGKMVQNEVRFDAKCRAKCSRIQGEKHKYPL